MLVSGTVSKVSFSNCCVCVFSSILRGFVTLFSEMHGGGDLSKNVDGGRVGWGGFSAFTGSILSLYKVQSI